MGALDIPVLAVSVLLCPAGEAVRAFATDASAREWRERFFLLLLIRDLEIGLDDGKSDATREQFTTDTRRTSAADATVPDCDFVDRPIRILVRL